MWDPPSTYEFDGTTYLRGALDPTREPVEGVDRTDFVYEHFPQDWFYYTTVRPEAGGVQDNIGSDIDWFQFDEADLPVNAPGYAQGEFDMNVMVPFETTSFLLVMPMVDVVGWPDDHIRLNYRDTFGDWILLPADLADDLYAQHPEIGTAGLNVYSGLGLRFFGSGQNNAVGGDGKYIKRLPIDFTFQPLGSALGNHVEFVADGSRSQYVDGDYLVVKIDKDPDMNFFFFNGTLCLPAGNQEDWRVPTLYTEPPPRVTSPGSIGVGSTRQGKRRRRRRR